jgi:exopolysaccharide production protein ExoQ
MREKAVSQKYRNSDQLTRSAAVRYIQEISPNPALTIAMIGIRAEIKQSAEMPRASTHPFEAGRVRPTGWAIDRYSIIPVAACVYATIVFPLILVSCDPDDAACLFEARPESRIFWPLMATISVILALRNYSRLKLPPHIVCLFAYLAFAGTSVLWAFKPEISAVRFAQQAMIVVSIVPPALLAARTTDLMRGLFLCFAVAAILNLGFVFGRPPISIKFATWGYPGYFAGKNYLGEFATVAVLLSLHEMLYPGLRRTSGIIVGIISVALLILSNSKTSMGLAVLVPFMAWLTLMARRFTRISLAFLLLSIPVGWGVLSTLSGFSINRLSNILYGDPTFTGRTIIWDFANSEIARYPLLGWGYQSFWLVGPDAPSILEAPGWVKTMPNAHNGYLDTKLEMGYAGFALLIAFISATLHAIGRVADRNPARAWILLSLALHIIITNGLESLWMRGFEMLWVVFLIIAADIGRYWKPVPPTGAFYARGIARPTGPLRGHRRPPVPRTPVSQH